jgi:hypothetical protein
MLMVSCSHYVHFLNREVSDRARGAFCWSDGRGELPQVGGKFPHVGGKPYPLRAVQRRGCIRRHGGDCCASSRSISV